jgi:uncharacterized protein YkwD
MGCGSSKPKVKDEKEEVKENKPEGNQELVIKAITINSQRGGGDTQTANPGNQTNQELNTVTVQIVKSPRTVEGSTTVGINHTYIHSAIEAHNAYRSLHKVGPLKHNPHLSQRAQQYAEQLVREGELKHSDCMWEGKHVGENIAWVGGGQLDAKTAVDMWYNEIKDYNFNNPGFSMSTGHFTQVVWKGSQYVGVGVATANGQTFVVGNYHPPGNYQGQFQDNVFPS